MPILEEYCALGGVTRFQGEGGLQMLSPSLRNCTVALNAPYAPEAAPCDPMSPMRPMRLHASHASLQGVGGPSARPQLPLH